jgi:dihydroceramidase
MHLAIGALLHQVFTFGEPPAIQRRNTFIILGIIVPFVIYHCLTDEFILHLLLFFGMSLTVAYRISHIIKLRIKDAGQRRKLRTLVRFATSSALLAFFIWNVDNLFCPTLTRWKQKVGKPWAFLLEGHGYWHMLTAMSSYCFMALSEFLTSPEGHESTGVGFGWPASVVLRDLGTMPKANGHVDGTRNGPMEKERAKDK